MLAVRIPQALEKRLELLSKKNERSKSYYIRKALESFLDGEEERQIALEAYDDYLKSGKKIHSLEDVLKENDLEA
jgi:RHH-type rel operon transcriptional repressor/antitoxin RelB